MYCSSCGVVVAPGLSYCSQCGAIVSGAKSNSVTGPAELFPDSLIWAIVGIFVIGLGSIMGLMAIMKNVVGFNLGTILAVTVVCFLLMLVIESVFIGLLMSRRSGVSEAGNAERLKDQTTKALGAAPARVLSEPIPSVTEHTTRTFEPIYGEREAK